MAPLRLLLPAIAFCLMLLGNNSHSFAQDTVSDNDLLRDMHYTAGVVKEFYAQAKHLPLAQAEQDKLLHILYKKSSQYNPDVPLPMASSNGTYRELGRFRITFDLSINQESNTLILWRRTPPDSWEGKAGMIGIVTNGDSKFLLYAIGANGNPIRSDNNLTIFNTYDCKSGETDEKLF